MKRRQSAYEEEEKQTNGEERGMSQNQPQGEGHAEKAQTTLNDRDATEVVQTERGLDGAVILRRCGEQRHLDCLWVIPR